MSGYLINELVVESTTRNVPATQKYLLHTVDTRSIVLLYENYRCTHHIVG